MKILTAEQIRDLDKYTTESEPISSIDLMERASIAFVDKLLEKYPYQSSLLVLCGKGNNGGDGLAIARILLGMGKTVRTVVIEHSEKSSKDHSENFTRLYSSENYVVESISSKESLPQPDSEALIIDAILGSGLDRPLKGLIRDVVETVNTWPNRKVSVDIPTGLFAEFNAENEISSVFKAGHVISFHAPKLAFMFADNAEAVPSFEVADIELLSQGEPDTELHFLTHEEVDELIKPRTKFSYKGTFGHALIMAGSLGKIGAAILSGKAALRSGCGLLTMRAPLCGLNPIQAAYPEAMCWPDPCETHLSESIKTDTFSAIGIGPGIGVETETQNVLKLIIQDARCPLVLDADALNILAENPTWMQFLPPNTILTPHPGEFDRITGGNDSAEERFLKQQELSRKTGCIIVLKGAHTSIACPDGQVIFNSTGNAGMATAGSGDVLTGIIAGLLAQGYHPKHAAIIGVFKHGKAGDLASEKRGEHALIAGDIIEAIR